MSNLLLLLIVLTPLTYAYEKPSVALSPKMIRTMLDENKFVRYVQDLPLHNSTKSTMMMVARIRKQLPEDSYYNTTTFLSFIAQFDKTYSNELEAAEKYKNVKYSMGKIEEKQKENPRAVFGLTKFADLTENQFLAQQTFGKKMAKSLANHVGKAKRLIIYGEDPSLEFPFIIASLHALDMSIGLDQEWKIDLISLLTMSNIVIWVETNPNIRKPMSKETKDPLTLPKPKVSVETSVDWRQKGKVSPIKNQGSCGSCYAFAAVAAIESQYAIKTGKMIDLSEQQAISCTYNNPKYGYNNGCNGGYSDAIFKYVTHHGLTTEANWPNESSRTRQVPTCRGKRSAFHVKNYRQLRSGDEGNMEETVRTIGPIATYIDADALQWYKSGVISAKGGTINHAVTIVGFTKDHWIVKNSWGTNWGEDGYFRVEKGKNAISINQYNYVAY